MGVSPSSSALPLTPFLPPERIKAQFSKGGDEDIGWAPQIYAYYTPACSTIKLLKTGFPQSLHLTSPISEVDVSGRAPKIFISRAESHEVGGEGSEFSELVGGEGRSQENGEAGAGEGLSLRVMVRVAIESRNGPIQKSGPRSHGQCHC